MVKMATGIHPELSGARDARCRRLLNRHERLEGASRNMQLTERKSSEIGTFNLVVKQDDVLSLHVDVACVKSAFLLV